MKTITPRSLMLIISLFMPGIAPAQRALQTHPKIKSNQITMSTTNKETVRNLYLELLNKRNFTPLKNLVSENYAGPGGAKGVPAFEAPVFALIKSMPDAQWEIQQLIADGDEVMVRWKVKGTQNAPFQSFAATGKIVIGDGIGIYTFKDGKIESLNVQTDRLGFLQQLGVLPADINSLAISSNNPQQVFFIDKFIIPQQAKEEFMSRANYNRQFIKNLPGFLGDRAYRAIDASGNLLITTVAVWESEAALSKAREIVQAEYKRIGFDPAEMTRRLGITLDRGIYKAVD